MPATSAQRWPEQDADADHDGERADHHVDPAPVARLVSGVARSNRVWKMLSGGDRAEPSGTWNTRASRHGAREDPDPGRPRPLARGRLSTTTAAPSPSKSRRPQRPPASGSTPHPGGQKPPLPFGPSTSQIPVAALAPVLA